MMAPASQVSGPFTIQTSIGKYSETRLRRRRVFALQFKLAGATTGDGMEVEQLSQCSGCCRSRSEAVLTLCGINQSLGPLTWVPRVGQVIARATPTQAYKPQSGRVLLNGLHGGNRHIPVTHVASTRFEAASRSVGVTTKPRSRVPRMSTSGSITT